MKKFLVLFPILFICMATIAYAEDTATLTVTVKNVPQELQDRAVIVTLGNGPSDTEAMIIVLDGLNNYMETVTVDPAEYYCAAAVQYDALGEYSLQETDKISFFRAEPGTHYELTYTLAENGWYENITGQQRHYKTRPLETPPKEYEPEPAQIGAYLTAPIGFSQHVIVYLQNLYTGSVYALDIYESNGLAAVETDAVSGEYAFLSAYAVGDAEKRYRFSCEQSSMSTDSGVDFPFAVTNTTKPEQEMSTPNREQNNTVQEADSFNNGDMTATEQSQPEEKSISQPVKQQEKRLDLLSLLLDFMPVLLVGIVLFAIRHRYRH